MAGSDKSDSKGTVWALCHVETSDEVPGGEALCDTATEFGLGFIGFRVSCYLKNPT